MSTIKLIYSHARIPVKGEVIHHGSSTKVYNKWQDVFFEIPENVTIFFSTPGRGRLACSETITESQLKRDLIIQGVEYLYSDPTQYYTGLRAIFENMGLYNDLFPDFSINFDPDPTYWNIWTSDAEENRKFIPFKRWNRDGKTYSLKNIVEGLSKKKHHYVFLQACNPFLEVWKGVELIKIQRMWDTLIQVSLTNMKTKREQYIRPKTRSQMTRRSRKPLVPDERKTRNENSTDLWIKDYNVDHWNMLSRRAKIYRYVAAMRPKPLTKPIYSTTRCLCIGPCGYQSVCDRISGICNNTKKCKVNPDDCQGDQWGPCK